jgi:hypothetical protein
VSGGGDDSIEVQLVMPCHIRIGSLQQLRCNR